MKEFKRCEYCKGKFEPRESRTGKLLNYVLEEMGWGEKKYFHKQCDEKLKRKSQLYRLRLSLQTPVLGSGEFEVETSS